MPTLRASARAVIRSWAAVETTGVPLQDVARCNRNSPRRASLCRADIANCVSAPDFPILSEARLRGPERATTSFTAAAGLPPMMRYDRRAIILAACFSGLAGYIDALGFIALGGFFVSFMTGNTTRLGIELAGGKGGGIVLAAGILALFVSGVVLGSLVGHFAGRRRPPAVLALVTTCLIISATLDASGFAMASICLLAVAMGSENAVFQRDGEVTIGLTYMTGTLVKMGQRIAATFLGGPPLAFLRHFLLWLGLLSGAVCGAVAHRFIGLDAIWLAAGVAMVLTIAAWFMLRDG